MHAGITYTHSHTSPYIMHACRHIYTHVCAHTHTHTHTFSQKLHVYHVCAHTHTHTWNKERKPLHSLTQTYYFQTLPEQSKSTHSSFAFQESTDSRIPIQEKEKPRQKYLNIIRDSLPSHQNKQTKIFPRVYLS